MCYVKKYLVEISVLIREELRSLECIEIMMMLEEKYGIEITDAEAQKIQTVKDLVEYLKLKNVKV